MNRAFLTAIAALVLLKVSVALAGSDREVRFSSDDIIFDTKVGAGIGAANDAPRTASPVVDVRGALVIGNVGGSNAGLDLGITTAIRDGKGQIVEGDVALKGRFLSSGVFGFEVVGLPFKYRGDQKYYELSAVEVSGIVKIVDGPNNQLLVKAGINPFTKRWYTNAPEPFDSYYDPTYVTSDGWVGNTYVGSDAILTSEVRTKYASTETSVRIPIQLEYKFKDDSGKLTITATAYYVLRAGHEKLTQTDSWVDQYDGTIAYTDDQGHYYEGPGTVIDSYDNVTVLAESKTFAAHTFGGKAEANYSLYKNRAVELLLNGTIKGELDTRVNDGAPDIYHTSMKFLATGGAILRF